MIFLKFSLAFALFYSATSEITDENHSYEVVFKGAKVKNCMGMIIGKYWAMTIKACIEGQDVQDIQIEDVRGNTYNVIKIEDTQPDNWAKFSHLDMILVKLDKPLGENGIGLVSPDMGEEESELHTQKNVITTVTEYKKCERQYGNKGGLFCSKQKQPPIRVGTPLYQNGLLSGIVIKSNKLETLSISAPYLANWMIENMSEAKPVISSG